MVTKKRLLFVKILLLLKYHEGTYILKILVTGGTGFIGSKVVKRLVRSGKEVVCLVLPGEQVEELERLKVEIVNGDLTKKETLIHAFKNVGCVIHLAASIGSKDSDLVMKVNYEGTKNLIDTIIKEKISIKRFTLVSSVAAAGPSKKGSVQDETKNPDPVSEYGRSKLLAEEYVRSIEKNFPFTIVRLPVVYGPGSYGGLYTIFKLVNRHLELIVPKMETNVLFVEDAANWIIKSTFNDHAERETLYIANFRVHNTHEIVGKIKKILGIKTVKIPISSWLFYFFCFIVETFAKLTNTKPILRKKNLDEYFKFRYWGVDVSKARKILNFEPEYSFEDGIRKTIKWYKSRRILR